MTSDKFFENVYCGEITKNKLKEYKELIIAEERQRIKDRLPSEEEIEQCFYENYSEERVYTGLATRHISELKTKKILIMLKHKLFN